MCNVTEGLDWGHTPSYLQLPYVLMTPLTMSLDPFSAFSALHKGGVVHQGYIITFRSPGSRDTCTPKPSTLSPKPLNPKPLSSGS